MLDSGWSFLRRAGTLIFASMIVVWALLYFPSTDSTGQSFEERLAGVEHSIKALRSQIDSRNEADLKLASEVDAQEQKLHRMRAEWKSQSILGRAGRAVEPAIAPLGWDWRIGMAVIASFPAREVVVGTLGIIYSTGNVEANEVRNASAVEPNSNVDRLRRALRDATWGQEAQGRRVFTVPVALSVLVFFALCCQCASTLAVIGRETHSWRWPLFTFTYMTLLAYVGALLVYQAGTWISS
jgi:ferrous iron transport protein B